MQGNALDLAVKEDQLEGAKLLMQHGANPMHCWKGTTTLERAIEKRNKYTTPNYVIVAVAIVYSYRSLVRLFLDKGGAKRGAWELDKEKLKDVTGCTSTKTSHRHVPFANLVTDLPGLQTIRSSLL